MSSPSRPPGSARRARRPIAARKIFDQTATDDVIDPILNVSDQFFDETLVRRDGFDGVPNEF
jgi:hypothetical protein